MVIGRPTKCSAEFATEVRRNSERFPDPIKRISNSKSEKEHKAMFSYKMRSLTTLKDFAREKWQVKIRKHYFSPKVIVIVLNMLLLGYTAIGQTTTSTIEGTVTDANGAVIPGAQVKASGATLATERISTTDSQGFYRLAALPAGTYTVTVSGKGFADKTTTIELTLNRVATFDVQLGIGTVDGVVEVTDVLPLLEPNASSTGATVTPKQIQDLPVNGRDYLDLLQIVPGVAINRQSSGDNANPVLGERSGNNNFFIDGQPNKDTVNGGPAAQFNQETIAEFQVLTTGYKAEFGQASGAIINVISRSGGNKFHGVGSFFHRNDALDSSNSLDPTVTEAPELSRFDYSLAGGGPIWKNKIFFFGSSERITEDRGVNFTFPTFPPALSDIIHEQEDPFDGPQTSREIRNFLKFNQHFGIHQLVQEMNYTNEYVRGQGVGFPSSRTNSSGRRLLLAFGDTMLLGDQANPWITTLRAAFRDEPSDQGPTNPEVVGAVTFVPFTAPVQWPPTISVAGDLGIHFFGSPDTPSHLTQNYSSFGANTNRMFGDHDVKFGWQYLRTKVDGIDSSSLVIQRFTTVADYVNFGPLNSGVMIIAESGAPTPEANEIHLLNHYNGLYAQDDWKIRKNLTINLGIRWDHDSEFDANKNFSPRLGVAWAVTPKTVIRAHFGRFFDQFRLGLVSQVPAFGGSDQRFVQSLYLPRGFYGSPNIVTTIARFNSLPGPCVSNTLTDAQIAASPGTAQTTCPIGGPLVGIDRLNRVVASGHALIPANAVINRDNIQSLSGLTPDEWLLQAASAIGMPAGYYSWGSFGILTSPLIPPRALPTTVDSSFKTPHTIGFSVGVQREITADMVLEVDYFHREMQNLLGVRISNLAFDSRVTGRRFLPPNTTGEIQTFGPFFEGQYDALVVSFNKRLSKRYMLGANYTWASATDNSRGINATPSDNFIGTVPEVTDPGRPGCPSQNNHNAPFTACNGKFVAEAGTFLNGPDLDKGPSSLALDHIFQVFGLVDLPWQFQISGIFRAQSGFHFSRQDATQDADGSGGSNGVDVITGRNAFTSDPFINADIRFSKRFDLGERVKLQVLFEFFNVFNRRNPASVQVVDTVPNQPLGSTLQVLPGREGQIGFRISF
jgi:hypothetical protein